MKEIATFLVTDPSSFDAATPRRRHVPADLYRWALEQADHLRTSRFNMLDRDLLADEIESLARSEFKSLSSNIEIILTHIIKWDNQSTKRSRSWVLSIDEHRSRVLDDLNDSPSLKARLDDAIERSYRYARIHASRETGIPVHSFPETCPYTWADITERPFVFDPE